jgi:hydroxymethylpyrimidine/phosphomethylpyrimidine kinase
MPERPVVLSIAGCDPSAGAGVTADVKTAAALDCYAITCPTALTIQSTQGVFGVEPVRSEVVRDTLRRLAEDVEIAAVRIGMLGSGDVATEVVRFLRDFKPRNVVLDPVLRSSSGAALLDARGIAVIRAELLPICDVVTPNLLEGLALAGDDSDDLAAADSWEKALPIARKTARRLHEMGAKWVVLTGGDLAEANDFISFRAGALTDEHILTGSRIESNATHGTGCAFATALACRLARGAQVIDAVRDAKEFVRRAITAAYPIGKGTGPMNHLFRLDDKSE